MKDEEGSRMSLTKIEPSKLELRREEGGLTSSAAPSASVEGCVIQATLFTQLKWGCRYCIGTGRSAICTTENQKAGNCLLPVCLICSPSAPRTKASLS